jgi:hypothetical protein
MGRFQFILLGVMGVSFMTGTIDGMVNQVLAEKASDSADITGTMCGLLADCSPGTAANFIQGIDRALAANIPILIADRSNEFNNTPSFPSQSSSRYTVPPYPHQPGIDVIRPDFGGTNLDTQTQDGIWRLTMHPNSSGAMPFHIESLRVNSSSNRVSKCTEICDAYIPKTRNNTIKKNYRRIRNRDCRR